MDNSATWAATTALNAANMLAAIIRENGHEVKSFDYSSSKPEVEPDEIWTAPNARAMVYRRMNGTRTVVMAFAVGFVVAEAFEKEVHHG